jgi:hypothetical protein
MESNGSGAETEHLLEVVKRASDRSRAVADELLHLSASVSVLTEEQRLTRASVDRVSRSLEAAQRSMMAVEGDLQALPELVTQLIAQGQMITEHTRQLRDIEQSVIGQGEVVGSKLDGVRETAREARDGMREVTGAFKVLAPQDERKHVVVEIVKAIGGSLKTFGDLSPGAKLLLAAVCLAAIAGWVLRGYEHGGQ